jgi:cyclohexanecarboxyl-CoA dehydrogenase
VTPVDFRFSPEEEQLVRLVRDFAQAELLPHYQRWDRTGEFPYHLWRRMGELGLTGTRVPEEYEGQGMSAVATGLVAEEVAKADFNLSYAVLMTALTGEVMRLAASEQVKREWMAPMARGDVVMGLALTEPEAGTDARRIQTRARRDGDSYVLDGQKSGISLAMSAHALVTFARLEADGADAGISAFLVPVDAAGVSRTAFEDMGSRAVGRGGFFFDSVSLPAGYLIGEPGAGLRGVLNAFDFSRFIIGLMCLGAAEQSLEETMAYVMQRKAFGRPIGQFEGVSFPIAEHATYVEAARWFCYRGLWLRDNALPHTKEAGMAKWWAPKVSVDCIHDCILLHGQYGYTKELPLEQRLRDVIGLEIGDGTAQVSKIVVARELLGRESLPY